MLTPLPYPDFKETARILATSDLNVARLDARQVVQHLLLGPESPCVNAKEVVMWKGYGLALTTYTVAMCDAWEERGFLDEIRGMVLQEVSEKVGITLEALEAMCHQDVLSGEKRDGIAFNMPPWLGWPALHESHRAHLLRHDPFYYRQLGWDEDKSLPLVWPVGAEAAPAASEPQQHKENNVTDTSTAPAPSADENMNREKLVDALREAGYVGPVSYTKTRLLEILAAVRNGETIEPPKRGRKAREGNDKESTPAAS